MSHASRRAVPRTNQWGALAALLLDFQSTPGRYATVAREPRLLFDHATEVLSLASGRSVEGLPADADLEGRLRQAACFFVRVAMLRPGVDHYTLLGVAPGFDATVLREHYRMLIRLTHPDFAAGGGAWPADAATRVNQANDVLASPERRQRYDHAPAATSPRGPMPPVRSRPAHRARWPHQRVQRRRVWPAVAGGLGVAVLLLAWFWQPETQHERLVTLASAPMPEPPTVPENAAPALERPGALAVEPKSLAAELPAEPAPQPAGAAVAVATVVPAEPPVVQPRDAGGPTPVIPASAKPMVPSPARQAPVAAVVAPAVSVRQQAVEKPAVVVAVPPPASTAAAYGSAAVSRVLPPKPPAAPPAVAVATPPAPQVVASVSPASVMPALPPPVPAPVTVAAALPARPPAPAPVPVPASPSRPVASAAETLRMADVQPLLGQILGALESGRGEQVTRLVDRSTRQGDGGARFVDAYNRALSGARVLKLGPVRFDGRASGEQLFVEGVVQLQIQDESHQPATRELVLRALFASRGGQPVLTQLSASDVGR